MFFDMKFRFISKDGKVEMREVHAVACAPDTGEAHPYGTVLGHPKTIKIMPELPLAGMDYIVRRNTLGRAIFDRRFSREATVKGEGNVQRALDIMWSKTKQAEALACTHEADEILSLMPVEPRVYRRHDAKSGPCYIELGTVFVDANQGGEINGSLKPTLEDALPKQSTMGVYQIKWPPARIVKE